MKHRTNQTGCQPLRWSRVGDPYLVHLAIDIYNMYPRYPWFPNICHEFLVRYLLTSLFPKHCRLRLKALSSSFYWKCFSICLCLSPKSLKGSFQQIEYYSEIDCLTIPKNCLRLALATCLNMNYSKCVVLIGLVCSSYVAVSSGTHRRYPHSPWGDSSCPFVALGSLLASRILVIQWLVLVKRGTQQWVDMSIIHQNWKL